MKIILGSSSISRKKVLEMNGYAFELASPDIDERGIQSLDNYELPLLIAREKAAALSKNVDQDAILICADQITIYDGAIHHKPENEIEARNFLEKYSSGNPLETVAALVVINTKTGAKSEGINIAKTYFQHIPEKVRDDFIAYENPYVMGGGFAVDSPILGPYVNKIEGTMDSVMGMPLELLEKLINDVQ